MPTPSPEVGGPRRIVLASASPRRKELLREVFPDFEVQVSDVDEDALLTDDPIASAENLARAKALAVGGSRTDCLVIGADTMVVIGNRILNKPESEAAAEAMLAMLSGKTHRVVTGICLTTGDRTITDHGITHVTFRELSGAEIREYVATGEPMDKAGAYAIQGGAARFVTHIEGSLSNVIGLPLELLRHHLTSVPHLAD